MEENGRDFGFIGSCDDILVCVFLMVLGRVS